MEYHNTDMAACNNDSCALKLRCLRWHLGTNKDPYQVYLMVDDCGDNCRFFIEREDK